MAAAPLSHCLRPEGNDNEARSADWAFRVLASAGATGEVQHRVHAFIMCSCQQAAPVDADTPRLEDINAASIGAEPARFAEYDLQERAEYRWVPGGLYRRKRLLVQGGFLACPVIYGAAQIRAGFERRDRENLKTTSEGTTHRRTESQGRGTMRGPVKVQLRPKALLLASSSRFIRDAT